MNNLSSNEGIFSDVCFYTTMKLVSHADVMSIWRRNFCAFLESGILLLDAPISGGAVKAAAGTLTVGFNSQIQSALQALDFDLFFEWFAEICLLFSGFLLYWKTFPSFLEELIDPHIWSCADHGSWVCPCFRNSSACTFWYMTCLF